MSENLPSTLSGRNNRKRHSSFGKPSCSASATRARSALTSLSCNVPSTNLRTPRVGKSNSTSTATKKFENATSTPKVILSERSNTERSVKSILERGSNKKLKDLTLKDKHLLTQVGNKRQDLLKHTHKIDANSSQQPKSILVTPFKSKMKTPKRATSVYFDSKIHKGVNNSMHRSVNSSMHRSVLSPDEPMDKSMMGYDWIAGLLDADSSIGERSEEYFQELKEFRRVNREECCSSIPQMNHSSVPHLNHSTLPLKVENLRHEQAQQLGISGQNLDHICSESAYVLNHRLQPIPIHGPYSDCEICKSRRSAESEYKDSYVRVTVPRSALQSPYRIRPHRRTSYDPSDSVALSEHCLSGWQSSKPSCMATQKNVDLKSNIDEKNSNIPSLFQKQGGNSKQLTDKLLEDSVMHRYRLQLMEKDLDFARPPYTTKYGC